MKVESLGLTGVYLITPDRFDDARGHFSESWNAATLDQHGITLNFVQDNQSYSRKVGTVRGLHYQAPPYAQDKLVRVVQGAIFDVAVDVRQGSVAYGQWAGAELSAENGRQILVPKGFLHGFVTRAPDTIVLYKTSAPYMAEADGAVAFDCPDLAIPWGIAAGDAVLSARDAAAPRTADWHSPFSCTDIERDAA
ncbi:dTDP-4-dehydrorhamnose 3,5-epimerase [Shimia ponticola]|uniref:dTDP-4-dehydrorhamnose 3,5-epimerase n=1 Tax=Shimia ponticola TaxID=2582893 RepID=UPI0011BEFC62|nr:dTDP-4-dehydrorhamnose 3,5-epimerase [Shimia ponticola]